MKKTLFLISLVSLFLISACNDNDGKTQTLEEFYTDEKIESIDKVIIQAGSTGAGKTITKQEQIDEFISQIKDVVFTPQDNQEERKGWSYRITLFDGERKFDFTLSHIGNTYYDSSPDIHPIVDGYYRKLEMEEK